MDDAAAWERWEARIRAHGVVIDRPRTPHPRFPASLYPTHYGCLPGTVGGDGQEIDVFVGSAAGRGLVGLLATHDAAKGDREIKLLWNLTDEEIAVVVDFVNRGQMTGQRIVRPGRPAAAEATVKRKVFAYITHQQRLLLFCHRDFPEAGIQAPGGTVKPGEDPAAAALREAREETGLTDLTVVALLGESLRSTADLPHDGSPGEVHHRSFYHLRCHGDPPQTWRHEERHGPDGEADPIVFTCFWAPLVKPMPALIADQGLFIPRLIELVAAT